MGKIPDNPFVGTQEGTPNVEINIGQVTYDDTQTQFLNDPQGSGIFTDCLIRNRYEKNPHKYMLPIASPLGFQNQKAAFVQLAAPTLVWICEWTIAKVREKPTIPNPTPIDQNWILISASPSVGQSYELPAIRVGPDGNTVMYRASGVYIYGQANPATETVNDMNWPRPPWVTNDIDRTLPTSLYEQYLIDDNLDLGIPL